MVEYSLLLLPYDILINIIKNLDLRDLRSLMLTCKPLREVIINENAVWRMMFRNKPIINKNLNRYTMPLSFYNQCRISNNWCRGIFKNRVILQHGDKYMPWLKLRQEGLFLSLKSNLMCYPLDKKGYPNCKNATWTLNVPTVKRNDVRTNDISRFVVKDNLIVCGNRDGSATIYTYDNNQTPHLFHHIQDCHKDGELEVSAVEVMTSGSNMCVVTASGYSSELSLWYWKWREDNCDMLSHMEHTVYNCDTVPNHPVEMGLRCLAVNHSQDRLAIGLNRNSKPLLLDISTCYLLLKADDTRDTRQVIRDIQWHDENTIMYVTHYGALQFIDTRTNSIVYNAEDPFQSSLYCVRSDGNNAIVAGSSLFSRCVLFDRRYKQSIQVYFTQKTPSPVYSLDFDTTKLIAAADRSTAALNFNVSVATTHGRDYSHAFEVVRDR